MEQRQTRVILASDTLTYLPVFLARDLNPSIELENGATLKWSDALPCIIDGPLPSLVDHLDKDQRDGDLGCLNSVLEAWKKGIACIGICDPCEIPVMGKTKELVIVGGLIRHACFWCVAHPTIAGAKAPEYLNADYLAIHEAGFVTGNGIGRQVSDKIKEIYQRDTKLKFGSVGLVVDGAVSLVKDTQHTQVAAITASILSAALADREGTLKLSFPLHDLPEYQDFLTTGIVVHREALRDEDFKNHVKLLLFGIILARRHLLSTGDQSVQYISSICSAPGRFKDERQLDNAKIVGDMILTKDETQVDSRSVDLHLAKLIYDKLFTERDIYCSDCDITAEQWEKGRFGQRVQSFPTKNDWPTFNQAIDLTILREAQSMYNDRMMTDALKRDQARYEKTIESNAYLSRIYLFVALVSLVFMVGLPLLSKPSIPLILFSIVCLLLVFPRQFTVSIGRRVNALLSFKKHIRIYFVALFACCFAIQLIGGISMFTSIAYGTHVAGQPALECHIKNIGDCFILLSQAQGKYQNAVDTLLSLLIVGLIWVEGRIIRLWPKMRHSS